MRVLSIVPYPVLPLTHGGRVRAYRLAVGLAQAGAMVELACPWHPTQPLRPFESDGITIRPFVFATNVLPALLGDRVLPPLVQLSLQPFTRGPTRLLRRSRSFDVVEFHFCAYGSWMRRFAREARIVYSAHNVELDYALTDPPLWLRKVLARRIGQLECRAVQASDLVVTCTESDGKRLAHLCGDLKRLALVPNGFDAGEIQSMTAADREQIRAALGLRADELAILFIGGPASHNRKAVQFLENELISKLQRPARLIIVGQCAPRHRAGRVIALGVVDRLGPVLAAADVAVNPIESGSGSNVKLAEYLGAGLPVVTTPVGLRGYESFAHLVTVAERDEFVEAIEAQRPVADSSPELLQLSWTALGRQLYHRYADLIAQRR